MNRPPLSDDQLRDLLREAYPAKSQAGPPRRSMSPILSAALFILIGFIGGAFVKLGTEAVQPASSAPIVQQRDPVEAVQQAASQYSAALSQLASTTSAASAAGETNTVAREVAAASFVGVTRSFISAIGDSRNAVDMLRLVSVVNNNASGARPADAGVKF